MQRSPIVLVGRVVQALDDALLFGELFFFLVSFRLFVRLRHARVRREAEGREDDVAERHHPLRLVRAVANARGKSMAARAVPQRVACGVRRGPARS